MSGNERADAPELDRRVRKTHDAILAAFGGLIHGRRRRYAQIRVSDIVGGADVGRSTFYEHYKSKDDMLLASMSGMLDVLATAVTPAPDVARLELILAHFLDMRPFAREVMWGPGAQHLAPRIARELAVRVEAHLAEFRGPQSPVPVVPMPLIAAQVAEAQLALIRAWLTNDANAKAGDVALAMCRSARGAAEALLR